MAKYQRELLVPYLRDVYALHLALHKLQERLDGLAHQKRSLERGFHHGAEPMKPPHEAANGVFLLGLGAYMFLSAFVMFLFNISFFIWFFVLWGIMSIVVGTIRYVQVSRENINRENRYKEKLAAYRQIQGKKDGKQKDISVIVDKMRQCQTEIERAQDALQRVYSANLIPEHYQNMDAAGFLYVWFCTGSPDDLDAAFNVFSLVGANAKLDQNLSDQTESILKHYLRFAKHHRPAELRQKHTANMESKLNQMDVSQEERNTYLAMIESNAAATAYFASANYLLGL